MAQILVIDDSPTVFLTVRDVLAMDGHTVKRLDRFVDLPSVVSLAPPDLILLDLDLPTMPGVTFGNYIRKYQSRDIPIIIHSARSEDDMRKAAVAVGALGVVGKGTPPDRLRQAVGQYLRDSK